MRRKRSEEREARLLRHADWPLRRIALELGVSVSSVSVWVRDVRPVVPDRRPPAVETRSPSPEIGSRRCGRCGEDLPLADFSRHPQRGHQWWCKECFRKYFKARGAFHRKQSAAARRRRRLAARAFITEYLSSHPCAVCGEADVALLEFDHVRSKQSNMSVLVAAGWSLRRIRAEIALCEVVCVNCHRRRTARRTPSWRADPSRIEKSTRLTPGERRNMLHVCHVLQHTPCVDCGCADLLVLEFDHVGTKRANVIDLARNGCAFETLRNEISQCEVRCANCHRRRTRARWVA
jgi:hypothetical protein